MPPIDAAKFRKRSGSGVLIPIAALAFAAGEGGQRIERAAEIHTRFEPHPATATDPSPASCQDDRAEKIRHDFDLVVPPLVQLRPDPGEGNLLGKQRQLHCGRPGHPDQTPARRASNASAGGLHFGRIR